MWQLIMIRLVLRVMMTHMINTATQNRKYMDIPLSTNFIRKFSYKTMEFLRIKNNNNFVIQNHIFGTDIFRST